MTPVARIREAQKNFFFAALKWAAMKNGLYKYTDLPAGFSWTIDDETRYIKWQPRSEKGFRTLVINQLRAALAILVIETDSVLNDCLGIEPYNDTDDERRNTRCIMYMFRCAVAHHPLEPTWNVTSENYKDKIFIVPSVDFTLDTTGLNGKPLDAEGLNWFKLIDLTNHCITYIE